MIHITALFKALLDVNKDLIKRIDLNREKYPHNLYHTLILTTYNTLVEHNLPPTIHEVRIWTALPEQTIKRYSAELRKNNLLINNNARYYPTNTASSIINNHQQAILNNIKALKEAQ